MFKATKIAATKTHYYEAANVEVVRCTSSEDFFLYGFRETIKSQINEVLMIEAPVSKNLLSKRVLLGWGIGRIGSRIAVHFELIFKELSLQQTNDNGNIIFWRTNQQPKNYDIYRLPPNEALKRDADDLPSDEVANGINEILKNQISLTRSDLVKEGARLFGYARIGTNVEIAMQKGIQIALAKGFAKIDNERLVYIGK